ncbi:flagellar hook-length control protein FliK [Vibrio cincinnatiensis]|nr:flagellar hook-length control protein FliK [Vibrio cincinnatiensis]MCG3730491.1 flagellar hook-length control protein FliK [Vibrio cincinnatiensis]
MNINPISSVDSKPISSVSATNANSKNISSKEGEAGEVTGFLDKLTALLFHSQSEVESENTDLAALPIQSEEISSELIELSGEESEQAVADSQDEASTNQPVAHSKQADIESLSTLEHEESLEPSITTAQVMNQGDELLGRLQQANQTLVKTSGKNLPNEDSEWADFSAAQKQDAVSLEAVELPVWDNQEVAVNKADATRTDVEFSDRPLDESGEAIVQLVDEASIVHSQIQQPAQNTPLTEEEEEPLVAKTASSEVEVSELAEQALPLTQGEAQVRHEPSKPSAPSGSFSFSAMAASSQPPTHPAGVSAMVNEAPFTATQAGSAAAISMPEFVQSTPGMDPNVLKASLNGAALFGKEKESLGSEPESNSLFAQQLASAAGQSTTAQPSGLRNEPAPIQGQPLPLALNKGMVADEMAERVQMMMSKNLKNIDIRLDPPELGRMHIRMNMHGDGASVQFTVANSQARDALEQSMPRLREMLAQQGVQLADTSVQQQNAGQQQRYSANGGESGSSAGREVLAGDENIESDIKLDLNVTTKRDGISYYA